MNSFVRQTWTNIKNFPAGLKKVFNETKEAFRIGYKVDAKFLSRRDAEFVRSNYQSLKKLTVLLVAQAVPIIGYIPLVFAFQYPKQILTHHFWTDEQKDLFAQQDYSKRHLNAVLLLGIDQVLPEKSLSKGLSSLPELSMGKLSTKEIDLLCGVNSVSESDFALKLWHNSILRRRLTRHAKDIVADDIRFVNEGVALDKLTPLEVKLAASKRGVNPSLPSCALRDHLAEWLTCAEMKAFRDALAPSLEDEVTVKSNAAKAAGGESKEPRKGDDVGYGAAMVLHAVAVNVLRTQQPGAAGCTPATASKKKIVHAWGVYKEKTVKPNSVCNFIFCM